MTDRERVKLLFGPYKAPPLKCGDRAFCLFRDADVVIPSWTDAGISWPRCRAIDSPGPDSIRRRPRLSGRPDAVRVGRLPAAHSMGNGLSESNGSGLSGTVKTAPLPSA